MTSRVPVVSRKDQYDVPKDSLFLPWWVRNRALKLTDITVLKRGGVENDLFMLELLLAMAGRGGEQSMNHEKLMHNITREAFMMCVASKAKDIMRCCLSNHAFAVSLFSFAAMVLSVIVFAL